MRLYRPGICFHVCLFRFEGDGTRRVSELIGREDRDIAASVQTVLEKKGIAFHLNAKVQFVDGATVIYEDAVTHEIHHLEGDAILLATGRRPKYFGTKPGSCRRESE